MHRDLAFSFSQVTEAAALAGFEWIGRGDKNKADGAAVEAMRERLNSIEFDGEIVIGEGEIDDAPMLYIGEKVGTGQGDPCDIAVDPIDGTRMTAMGQSNAIAVMAVGEAGAFLKAPDMYMEKLVVGPGARGAIDLTLPLMDNLVSVAKALGKPISKLVVITLAKERHQHDIAAMQALGVKVFCIPDGDVAASILTCLPESEVDLMYCVGGAPEGVVSAAVIRALGGDMQGRLMLRTEAKEESAETIALAEEETRRCHLMGVQPNRVYALDQLVSSDNVVFAATGVTHGDLLKGVTRKGNIATTETLLVRGACKTIQRIQTTHVLDER